VTAVTGAEVGGGNISRFGYLIRVLSSGQEMDSSRGSMHPRDKSSTCRRQGAGGRRQEARMSAEFVDWGLSRPHTLFL